MNLNPDDPRLTAYALGEMPEVERAAFEMELRRSPECKAIVEEIRQTAALLESNLATEEVPGLSLAQQQQIENQLRPTAERPRSLAWRLWFYGGISAAAACLMAALLLPGFSKAKNKAVRVTLNQPNTEEQPIVILDPKSQPINGAKVKNPTAETVTTTEIPTLRYSLEDKGIDGQNSIATPQSVNASGQLALAKESERNPQNAGEVALNYNFSLVTPPSGSPSPVTSGLDSKAVNPSMEVVHFENAGPGEALSVLQDTVGQASRPTSIGNPYQSRLQTTPAPVAGESLNRYSTAKARSTEPNTTLPGSTTVTGNNPFAGGRMGGGGGGGGFGGSGRAGGSGGTWYVAGNSRGFYDDSLESKAGDSATSKLGDSPALGYLFRAGPNTATYPQLIENSFLSARTAPLSTFSIDVDTASYANVRRFLKEGRMPPRDAVRIEEMINYFSYKYPQPRGSDPFAAGIEVAGCPWNPDHRLVRIGVKGREIAQDKRPPSNFVFLIDVSGSMQPQERLPLIKQALRQLVKKMNEHDRVAIMVYASEAGLKLESTSCAEKEKILQAIDELGAGGSTNGGDGIRQAYRVAEENFIREGVNRVLLCTDGDFNVGMTDQNELVRMIQQKAKSGVFLTTLGVGTDNYKDALMQKLADKGNGNYHYLDTLEEAQKVLIDQMNGTLVTIAKDVKIQVEFNPARVGAYRLIGYEKRMLRKEDFNNDAKDAGEIGAGHTVTALYEIVPAGREIPGPVDDLKYQQPVAEKPERYVTTGSRELLTLKLRYKQPDGDRSRLLEFPVTDGGKRFSSASKDFQFAASVASFGMLLRESEYKGNASYGAVLEWATDAKGADEEGYRAEFINLVRTARSLDSHKGGRF